LKSIHKFLVDEFVPVSFEKKIHYYSLFDSIHTNIHNVP
jgi:hypothetical protein